MIQDLRDVQEFEQNVGGIILDPSTGKDSTMYFSTKHPLTVSPRYAKVHEKKAHLVIRMLDIRIGRELLLQVSIHWFNSFILLKHFFIVRVIAS